MYSQFAAAYFAVEYTIFELSHTHSYPSCPKQWHFTKWSIRWTFIFSVYLNTTEKTSTEWTFHRKYHLSCKILRLCQNSKTKMIKDLLVYKIMNGNKFSRVYLPKHEWNRKDALNFDTARCFSKISFNFLRARLTARWRWVRAMQYWVRS